MHGKLELTAFNKQPVSFNESHNEKRHPNALMSSFGIRQSSPRRVRVYNTCYSETKRGKYNCPVYRRSEITSSKPSKCFDSKDAFFKNMRSTGVTIIDLANSAQCLIVNSLQSAYTQGTTESLSMKSFQNLQ
ncbi:unnamed protein product [Heterobilharzia americana]|nr:unnamed protein product [Heterobilharzia americana]